MTERVITYDEIQNHIFIWGDLLWIKKSGKVVTLAKCGECLDHGFIEKIFKRNEEVKIKSYLNEDLVSEVVESFKKLKETRFERERVEIREDFLLKFTDTIVSGQTQGNLIDWVQACFEVFYELPKEVEDIYTSKNFEAFQRCFAVASLSTLVAFSSGYLNFNFLKNIYNTVLLIDIDMVENGMSEFHFKELEKQRLTDCPQLSGNILEFHKDHMKNSKELIKQVTKGNPALEQLIEFHHEVLDCGKGPRGIFESETGDLQKIVNFIERAIPYSDFHYSEGDGTGFMKPILETIPGHERIKKILKLSSVSIKQEGVA